MLSPAMETSSITPSVYSVHALTLLSEVNVSSDVTNPVLEVVFGLGKAWGKRCNGEHWVLCSNSTESVVSDPAREAPWVEGAMEHSPTDVQRRKPLW